MPNQFDPYRDALVIEEKTRWPEEIQGRLDEAARTSLSRRLHDNPQSATELEYIRLHSGFCRSITITEGDIKG